MEIPLFQGISTPYDHPFYGIFWEHIFCSYGGWGWSELFSNPPLFLRALLVFLRASMHLPGSHMVSVIFRTRICRHGHSSQGWPFTLRGGCGAEVRKLPQWLLPLWCLAIFFTKGDAEIGHLPGGFKCEFGGENRVWKESVSMRKLKLRESNAENCVN